MDKAFWGISHGSAQKKAFEEFLIGSPLLKKTADRESLLKKTSELTGLFGEYRAFERISAKRIGNDLVLMKYLYKCEDFPVVWYFTFYRTQAPSTSETPPAKGPWRVIAVRFDTELELPLMVKGRGVLNASRDSALALLGRI